MQRRNITIRGKSLNNRLTAFKDLKDKMREHLRTDNVLLSERSIEQFTEWMLRSGWDRDDIQSAAKQQVNEHRPPVSAFTFHNEHVFDQLYLTQGTYTHFNDTAQDPNYALRHRGQTELTMRRLTPGDLLLLQAAQIHSGRLHDADLPSEQQWDYWTQIWRILLELLIPTNLRPLFRPLWDDPYVAAATAYDFFLRSPEFGAQV